MGAMHICKLGARKLIFLKIENFARRFERLKLQRIF